MDNTTVPQQSEGAAMRRGKARITTKDILVAGMIAVVFAFVQVGIIYAFIATTAAAGPLYARLLNGFWFMPGFMAMLVIRKPGIGFIALAIAGIVMTPLTPFGIVILFGTLIDGLLTELTFFLTRYKRYNLPVIVTGMSVLSLVYTLIEYGPSGYGGLSVPIQIGILASSAVGGALCGLLCKKLTDGLMRTGLLTGYSHTASKVES